MQWPHIAAAVSRRAAQRAQRGGCGGKKPASQPAHTGAPSSIAQTTQRGVNQFLR